LAAFDLESQFFHVKLEEEQRKYFGFIIINKEGQEEYYQFCVMPFGLSSAVAVVTRLLQPVKAYLHKLGVKLSLYLDDGRIVARTEEEAVQQLRFVQQCPAAVWMKRAVDQVRGQPAVASPGLCDRHCTVEIFLSRKEGGQF
jgi:Reverse transcriptase (RNA-dependent DNA polymerase)